MNWVPKKEERYWYLAKNGEVASCRNTYMPWDMERINAGNCFRTKEEVLSNKSNSTTCKV